MWTSAAAALAVTLDFRRLCSIPRREASTTCIVAPVWPQEAELPHRRYPSGASVREQRVEGRWQRSDRQVATGSSIRSEGLRQQVAPSWRFEPDRGQGRSYRACAFGVVGATSGRDGELNSGCGIKAAGGSVVAVGAWPSSPPSARGILFVRPIPVFPPGAGRSRTCAR
jgi:hypothetical protein